jgi:hypothetical protein
MLAKNKTPRTATIVAAARISTTAPRTYARAWRRPPTSLHCAEAWMVRGWQAMLDRLVPHYLATAAALMLIGAVVPFVRAVERAPADGTVRYGS